MSDIDSKKDSNSNKDNSKKILDYVKKLGISIASFIVLILIGCVVLYASKSCGAGVLDILIPTYYIHNLTDSSFKPEECNTESPPTPELNKQTINGVNIDNKMKYQILEFDNNYFKDSGILYHGLNKKIKEHRDKVKSSTDITFFDLFINGITSSVSIFNLKLLNSYFKFLNKNFLDSSILILGPPITIIILFIIMIMSLFISVYYVVINIQWLVTSPPETNNPYIGHNKKVNLNGFIKGYYPSNNITGIYWLILVCKSLASGSFIIYICMWPFALFFSIYNIVKILYLILSFPSKTETENDVTKPYSILNIFPDTFKYKTPLISYIMSWMIVSTSFDIFDTPGGTIAIIVFLLIFFNVLKFGLFDKYVPKENEIGIFKDRPSIQEIKSCFTLYKVPEEEGIEMKLFSQPKPQVSEIKTPSKVSAPESVAPVAEASVSEVVAPVASEVVAPESEAAASEVVAPESEAAASEAAASEAAASVQK